RSRNRRQSRGDRNSAERRLLQRDASAGVRLGGSSMYLRDLVKAQWTQAGLYARKDAHLQSFLQHIDNTLMECWDDYVALFRRDSYDLFDSLIPPLIHSDDKLLRLALIRYADVRQPKELTALRTFIRQADPVNDRPELISILNRAGSTVKNDFLKR